MSEDQQAVLSVGHCPDEDPEIGRTSKAGHLRPWQSLRRARQASLQDSGELGTQISADKGLCGFTNSDPCWVIAAHVSSHFKTESGGLLAGSLSQQLPGRCP